MNRSRRLAVALATLALMLPLAACSAQSGNFAMPQSGADSSAPSDVQLRDMASVPFDGAEMSGDMLSAEGGSAGKASDVADRSIIKNGSIDLEVDSTPLAVTAVAKVAADFDGTVVSQQLWNSGGSTQFGSVMLTVPADKFDAALDELGTLGTVRGEQRSSDDVTAMHVDLTARVAALETSVTRLTALMAEASSMTDLLEIEGMLSARQAELDGLKAQLKSLEGQISESSISVSLAEESVLPGGGPKTFLEALSTGIASIGAFASRAVIVLGVALPWLLIAGVIAAAIIIPLKSRRKKRIANSVQPSIAPAGDPNATAHPDIATESVAETHEG